MDVGIILEVIWEGFHEIDVFSHLENGSDLGAHFRAPRGAPGILESSTVGKSFASP